MSELGVVTPNGLPAAAILRDICFIGDDLDMCRLFFAEEGVEDFAKDGLEAGGDDVKWDGVGNAKLVELLEVRVDFE